jgi:hypothetical protein
MDTFHRRSTHSTSNGHIPPATEKDHEQ